MYPLTIKEIAEAQRADAQQLKHLFKHNAILN
jgi:hypothetical protein